MKHLINNIMKTCVNLKTYFRSPSLFFKEYLPFCHFHARAIAKRRKAWFHLRMSRILFAAKHSRNTADHYLWAIICRPRVGLSINEKEK